MTISVEVALQAAMSARVNLSSTEAPAAGSNGSSVTLDGHNANTNLKSDSTPAITTEPADLSKTLASATETLDLTSIPAARDTVQVPDLDMSGKKLAGIIVKAATGNNTGGVTIKPSSSNGYNLFGASKEIVVFPGGSMVLFTSGAAVNREAVGAAAKSIDLVGTVGDQVSIMALFA